LCEADSELVENKVNWSGFSVLMPRTGILLRYNKSKMKNSWSGNMTCSRSPIIEEYNRIGELKGS